MCRRFRLPRGHRLSSHTHYQVPLPRGRQDPPLARAPAARGHRRHTHNSIRRVPRITSTPTIPTHPHAHDAPRDTHRARHQNTAHPSRFPLLSRRAGRWQISLDPTTICRRRTGRASHAASTPLTPTALRNRRDRDEIATRSYRASYRGPACASRSAYGTLAVGARCARERVRVPAAVGTRVGRAAHPLPSQTRHVRVRQPASQPASPSHARPFGRRFRSLCRRRSLSLSLSHTHTHTRPSPRPLTSSSLSPWDRSARAARAAAASASREAPAVARRAPGTPPPPWRAPLA